MGQGQCLGALNAKDGRPHALLYRSSIRKHLPSPRNAYSNTNTIILD